MKKKLLFVAVIAVLLVVSFFAGEMPTEEQESVSGSFLQEPWQMQEEGNPEAIATEEEIAPTQGEQKTENEKAQKQKDVDVASTVDFPEENIVEVNESPKQTATIASADSPQTEKVEKQEAQPTVVETDEKNVCTLSVRCDAVLDNMDKLPKEKVGIVPKDGVIYSEKKVAFSEGESAFDVLYREMRAAKIHFEFVKTPMYDSMYIEGIGNLYEFDCGDYSGWLYRVNGVKMNVGSSQYQVKKGDVITFSYTCNFLKER